MAVVAFVAGVIVAAAPLGVLLRRRQSELASCRDDRTAHEEHLDALGARVEQSAAELDRVRGALDALRVGVVLADRHGAVVVRNRSAEHPGGSRQGDLLVEGAVAEHLEATLRGEARHQLLEIHGPPHRILTVESRPLPQGGGVVTIDDITEQSRLDTIRTDFVANISHELKTPVGALAVLAEAINDADEPNVVEQLAAKLLDEAHRMAGTIDDLLVLSRIEIGGLAVREVVPAGVVLDEAVARARPLADASGIVLVVEPSPELAVPGDRRQLISALGHLVENAVKYSERGARVEVRAVADGEWIAFVVADQGIGIPGRDLDRVFERFYRVDRARSRETGGTGLGLAIVRHVASNHGGEVTVTSAEGVGSTFRLRIPATGSTP